MTEIKFSLPLSITPAKAKKKFILNLNNFRNTYFRTLNDSKHEYAELIKSIAPKLNYKIEECEITYLYYHGNKRRVDLSNPCSIIDKFTCDGLTDFGYWDDDDSKTITSIHYKAMGIDKDNPRCDVVINVIKKKENGRKKRNNKTHKNDD